jgi:hypothetical protein
VRATALRASIHSGESPLELEKTRLPVPATREATDSPATINDPMIGNEN